MYGCPPTYRKPPISLRIEPVVTDIKERMLPITATAFDDPTLVSYYPVQGEK